MGTRWLLSARRAMGAAYLLLGRPQEAIAVLRESLALSSRPTRAQPHSGLHARLSGLRGRRAGRAARRATMGGRSGLAGQPSNTSTTRSTAPSRTRQERSRTTNAVTRRRPHASSRTSGGSAHCSAWAHGSTPISRCAAPTSASTSATLPAPSNTRRSRATHYRDIPMPERSRPGCSVSKRGSGEDRTTDSHLPSSGSSLSCGRISPSRTSPIVFTSHALPSRHTCVDLRQARRHRPIRRCRGHRAGRPRIDRSQGHDASSRSRLASRCRIAVG